MFFFLFICTAQYKYRTVAFSPFWITTILPMSEAISEISVTVKRSSASSSAPVLVKIAANGLISSIKEELSEAWSVPVAALRLLFGGKILVDSKSIEFYGIKDNATILCLVSSSVTAAATLAPPVSRAERSAGEQVGSAGGGAPESAAAALVSTESPRVKDQTKDAGLSKEHSLIFIGMVLID
jgi:hypothetical protein